MENTLIPSRHEILTYGTYKKSIYGIAKVFEWKVYDYKRERYNISMFDNTINHVSKVYCLCCGRKYLPSMVKIYLGQDTCLSCIKQSGG